MSIRLQIAYRLRSHHLGAWALDRWLAALAFGGAVLLLAGWWIVGRPTPGIWHGLAFVALILAGGMVIRQAVLAARQHYVVFCPEDAGAGLPWSTQARLIRQQRDSGKLPVDTEKPAPTITSPPSPRALDPNGKVPVRATGRFGVAGKSHVWADLPAYWRTFATREHAVLAFVHASRWLLLGQALEAEVGMWYIFFKPEDVEAVTPGLLTFGKRTRPALRVVYRGEPPAQPGWRPRAAAQEARETLYLAFEDEAGRGLVWEDLIAD